MNDHSKPTQNEDSDDQQIGSILSRRRALKLFGLGSAALTLSACGVASTPSTTTGSTGQTGTGTSTATGTVSCVVKPTATEGPFWVDEKLNRSDIRADTGTGTIKAGVPLTLPIQIASYAAGGCTPLSGVMVDIWHADADGIYSDASGAGNPNTRGQNFLRGAQLTDAQGKVSFTTIYPGWYAGRAVHIHYRVRTLDSSGQVVKNFTSQFFFPESVTDAAFTASPYNTRGQRSTINSTDNIYGNVGDTMLLTLSGSPSA